jgi:hypothetical protein
MVKFICSLLRFLRRVLSDLPSSIGSNYAGIWFPLIPALLLLAYQIVQNGWATVKHDLLVGTIITIISYALLLLYCVVRNLYREHCALSKSLKDVQDMVSPLQLEGLALASEIRAFALSLGEIQEPAPPASAEYRKAVWEHLQSWIGSYPMESDPQLRARLVHGFEARRFSERVTQYMHRVGESGYPIFNASGFVESILDRRSLFRLSADIEIVAISTNQFPKPK